MGWKESASQSILRSWAAKPVIAETRVPVQVIVGSLAGGDNVEQVCEGYGVTEEDVRAALAYAGGER
jgi:uncharacterized protein (DUF433 family)